MKRLLVIARKFNDILYAFSTEEWRRSDYRILLILTQNIDCKSYPFQDRFDEVISVKVQSLSPKGQGQLIRDLSRHKDRISCDYVLTSNVLLLSHRYVIRMSGCTSVGLLEDGLMNYRDDLTDKSVVKKAMQLLLGINLKKIYSLIHRTYLLKPDSARYYFGERLPIRLPKQLIDSLGIDLDLNGKSIFVGQNLYQYGYLSKEEYCDLVNRVIADYGIDYYLPHAFAESEHINCRYLNLADFNVTLEMLAVSQNFTVYSFASSVLFTSKLLNPEVRSIMVSAERIKGIGDFPIYRECGVEMING